MPPPGGGPHQKANNGAIPNPLSPLETPLPDGGMALFINKGNIRYHFCHRAY